VVFPLIVAIGAGATQVDGLSTRIAGFFGELSYPLYITHYGLIYVYTEWIGAHEALPFGTKCAAGAAVFVASIAIAYACLRLYDLPMRRWLTGKLVKRAA
jgi:peptidoglycan/LPS O-acetylase OafA/YrhL